MKILKGLILTAFLISICFSQQKDTTKKNHSLEKKSWSIQFEIGNDFQLTSFDGVIVSLKYHFTPKFAFRFGAGMNLRSVNSEVTYLDYNSGHSGSGPLTDQSRDFLLTTYFLLYPKPNALFKIFFGIGPRGTYAFLHDERLYSDGYEELYETESWSAGLNGVFGIEWFPIRYLSLFGEYSVYGTYGGSTINDYVTDKSTGVIVDYYYQTANTFTFRGNIARLGLGVYF